MVSPMPASFAYGMLRYVLKRFVNICAACRLKKNQNVRQSAQGVVTEVELPIDDRDVAFESCVQRNADAIRRVVDEHQYRLR